MRQRTMVGLSLGVMVLLTGCSTQAAVSNQTSNQGSSQIRQIATNTTNPNNTAFSSGASENSANHPIPNAKWVLTNALVKKAKWNTEYNQSLSINHGVYGKTAEYSHWQLPSQWKPYLYKSEHYISPKSGPAHLNHKTLFITMQGTVFLKEGVAGRYWDAFSAMGIPPGATIVAEFVPIKPAVEAGIIPMYHGGEQVPGVTSASPKMLQILGMTKKEFDKDIGRPAATK